MSDSKFVDLPGTKEFRIEAFQQGEERALAFIVKSHRRMLVSYTRFYASNQLDAEDVVSEVFNVAWQSRFQFESYVHLRRFMFTAAKNKAIDLSEKRTRHIGYKYEYVADTGADEDCYSVPADIAENALLMALQRLFTLVEDRNVLPEKTRHVIQMTLNGIPDKKIAEKMDIARQNVSKYRQRGVLILKKFMPSVDEVFLQ
jgi:RNA polymerase sigma-70 factor (ECF subfamily)